jgi:thiaminase (transcriptional activator TenA)
MRFADVLQQAAEPIWAAIFAHPLLRQLCDGSLPIDTFQYFLVQDWHFLDAFARCVGLALGKAEETPMLARLAARVTAPVEKSLHRTLLGRLHVDPGTIADVPLAPTTRAYRNHLLVTATHGTLGETAAALLPCPWTYHALGQRLGAVAHPLYAEWAAFYTGGGLAESVRAWTELVDLTAATAGPREREAMRAAFLTSSRYEFAFWEMAARRETWPV